MGGGSVITAGEPLTVTVKISCARIRAGRDAKASAKRVEVNIASYHGKVAVDS